MKVELFLSKSVHENASIYFDKAKKAKKKKVGAIETVEKYKKELEKLQQQEAKFWEKEKLKEAKLNSGN